MKLTPDFLKNSKPDPRKRIELRDDDEPGLIFRITPAGSKSWSVRYVAATGEHRRKTYSYPDTGLARARVLARQLKGQTSEKRDVVGEAKKEKEKAERQKLDRLELLADSYFAACLIGNHRVGKKPRPKAPRTLEEEKRVWKVDLCPKLGSKPVTSISKREISDHIDKLTAQSPSTGRNAHRLLRQILNFGITRGVVEKNNAFEIATVQAEPRERFLKYDELAKVWALLNDIEVREKIQLSHEVALLLQFMILTPLRAGECAGMQWDEVDRAAAQWHIPAPRMKGKRDHLMPLSPAALSIVERAKQLIGNETYVFASPRTDKPFIVQSVAAAFRRVIEELKLERATVHDFRRTALTAIIKEKIAPRQLGKLLLAHADKDDTASRHYDMHDYLPEKADIANRWAALVLNIVKEYEGKQQSSMRQKLRTVG